MFIVYDRCRSNSNKNEKRNCEPDLHSRHKRFEWSKINHTQNSLFHSIFVFASFALKLSEHSLITNIVYKWMITFRICFVIYVPVGDGTTVTCVDSTEFKFPYTGSQSNEAKSLSSNSSNEIETSCKEFIRLLDSE